MTPTLFLENIEKTYAKNVEICKAKNKDYSGETDAFKNFRLVEELTSGVIECDQAIFVRMCDKFQRIANLLSQENFVMDETIEDTLADLANYAVILKVYLSWKKAQAKPKYPGLDLVVKQINETVPL